jgi:hypothetical protein
MASTFGSLGRALALLIVCFSAIIAGPADAQLQVDEHGQCGEELELSSDDPIGELISKSSYIGLYVAKRESPLSPRLPPTEATIDFGALRELTPEQLEARIRGDDLFAEYTLTLSSTLRGGTPHLLQHIRSLDTNDRVPGEYFFMNQLHQEIVDRGNIFLGNSPVDIDRAGACRLVPTLVDGYRYLVFGGTFSRISMEPILSNRFDPFYQAVLARLR